MNKFLKILHTIFIFSLIILTILFIKEYKFDFKRRGYIFGYRDFIVLGIFIVYTLISFYDLIKSRKNKFSTEYYFSNVIGLLSICLVVGRSVFDKTIVSNIKDLTVVQGYYCSTIGMNFVSSFYIYFEIILILLIIYRYVAKKSTKK